MTANLHAPVAHGIAVVGDVDLPADQGHARLREALRKRHPAGARLLSVVLLASLGLVALLSGPSASRSAPAAPDPYKPAAAQDVNPDPKIVETTISAQKADVDINIGRQVHALTFNGSIPGPTIRANVGDTVIVHFENHLDAPTGIHWHGVEVPNAMDGTPLTQDMVKPGHSFIYKFKVLRPGIFWYHPHHHSSTNQVFKGLYGAFVVRDPQEDHLDQFGVLPPSERTIPMVLSDMTVCKSPGSNDIRTYSPALPHVSGGPLPAQGPPTPQDLCETSPVDEDGAPRAPFAAGEVPNIQQAAVDGRTNEGQTVLTNGANVGPRLGTPSSPGFLTGSPKTLAVKADDQIRLQLVNASTVRYMRLHLSTPSGKPVHLLRIGGEGGLLDEAIVEGGTQDHSPFPPYDTNYDVGEILLPPGGRADVVARLRAHNLDESVAAEPGVYTLWTEDFLRSATGFANIPTVPVAHFQAAASPVQPTRLTLATPLRQSGQKVIQLGGDQTASPLDPAKFSPAKPGLSSDEIQMTTDGKQLGFDGKAGTHDAPGPFSELPHMASARYVTPGSTYEFDVTNRTGTRHPFHLHGFSIQPILLRKDNFPNYFYPYHEFVDTVDIPLGYTLRFRVHIGRRATADDRLTTVGGELGRWVMHCHIFFHAESGMLSELVVVDPNSNGHERPDVSSDDGTVTGVRGQRVTMTGTFADPNSEQVSFIRPHDVFTGAELGTITTSGTNTKGTWKWTYDMPASDKDHLVAMDAADFSASNATIFQLRAKDAPPAPTPTATPGGGPTPTPTPTPTAPPGGGPAPGPGAIGTPAPGATPGADRTAPSIRGLKARGGAKRQRFRLALSEPARVVIRVIRRKPKAKRRVRLMARHVPAGPRRLVARKQLRPGRYRATAIATDAAGNRSRPVSVTFRVHGR